MRTQPHRLHITDLFWTQDGSLGSARPQEDIPGKSHIEHSKVDIQTKMRRAYVVRLAAIVTLISFVVFKRSYTAGNTKKILIGNKMSGDTKQYQHVSGHTAAGRVVGAEYLINVESRHTIFVHHNTSFIDLRVEKRTILRMFGYLATRQNRLPAFTCIVNKNGLSSSVKGSGYIVTINDKWRGPFNRTAHFICELPFDARHKENKVSLISSSGEKGEIKKVGEKLKAGIKRTGFAICLPTLYNFSSPYVVAEWIEMQRLFGITKVYLYDKYGTAPDVDRVLNYYIKIGVLEIVHWNHPWRTAQYAHGHGTILNHCLYNLMEKYEYIGVYDFDEFLIPAVKKSDNKFFKIYPDLMDKLRSIAGPSRAGYSFGRKLFCLTAPDLKATDNKSLRAIHLVKDHGDGNMKTIIKPEYVNVLAIHTPREYRPGKRGVYIHGDIGIVHHYRQIPEACKTEDRSALVYADVIQDAIQDVFKHAKVLYTRL